MEKSDLYSVYTARIAIESNIYIIYINAIRNKKTDFSKTVANLLSIIHILRKLLVLNDVMNKGNSKIRWH